MKILEIRKMQTTPDTVPNTFNLLSCSYNPYCHHQIFSEIEVINL
jgi:hypothetical protein